MKKTLLLSALFSLLAGTAYSASINYTIFDNTPAMIAGPKPGYLSSGCFKLSCYNDAARFESENFKVQPLTNDSAVILRALNAYKASDLDDKYLYSQSYSYLPWGTAVGTSMNYSPSVIFGTSYALQKTWYGMQSGGYSSSMQGLLWSWRMVSNKWTGLWNRRSSYEGAYYDTYQDRTALPSSTNKKHIIIISDALDNDGPPGVTVADTATEYFTKLPYASPTLNFSVCDAHKPIQKIPAARYTEVCTAMKNSGIKVHTIYSGTGTNNVLKSCSTTTGGKYITLSTTTAETIAKALKDIQATMVNSSPPKNVKLVPVPNGY